MRDDFSEEIKKKVSFRVGCMCSNSDCKAITSGPQIDSSGVLNVGVAAHISAASPEGPRYDTSITHEERKGIENAIWLCQNCAKLVDNDPVRFTRDILLKWKQEAERNALKNIGKTSTISERTEPTLYREEVEILITAAERGMIYVLETAQLGKWVRVENKDFVNQKDPSIAALYLDGLDSLCHRGLAKWQSGILYRLTGVGFQKARALREESPGSFS